MKKLGAILFTFIYLISTTGFSLSVHQCQGKIDFEILGFSFNKSCKCKHSLNAKTAKCCSDKKIVIEKNTNDNFIEKTNLTIQSVVIEIISLTNGFNISLFKPLLNASAFYNKVPPDLYNSSRYLVNRVIRI